MWLTAVAIVCVGDEADAGTKLTDFDASLPSVQRERKYQYLLASRSVQQHIIVLQII